MADRKLVPAKGSRVYAPEAVGADPEHGVGAVPAGTLGTVVSRPVRSWRDGCVEVLWDNGARFFTVRWAALPAGGVPEVGRRSP
jgi:hypothetical protein